MLRIADPGGRLVYVVRREVIRRDGRQERIEVTTRGAAAKRGHRLPPELRLPLTERLKQPVAFHTEGKQPIAAVLDQFRHDAHFEVLVRWDDLPAAEGDQPRKAQLDAEKMPAGEALRIRSWMYYVLAGGAAMAAIPVLASQRGGDLAALPAGQYMTIFAAAGFAGGLVYWLLAGRNA